MRRRSSSLLEGESSVYALASFAGQRRTRALKKTGAISAPVDVEISRALFYVKDLHRLGERVDGLLMLPGLVQRFAFGAVFLHLIGLGRGERGILGHRVVDLLHVLWAMKRKRGTG